MTTISRRPHRSISSPLGVGRAEGPVVVAEPWPPLREGFAETVSERRRRDSLLMENSVVCWFTQRGTTMKQEKEKAADGIITTLPESRCRWLSASAIEPLRRGIQTTTIAVSLCTVEYLARLGLAVGSFTIWLAPSLSPFLSQSSRSAPVDRTGRKGTQDVIATVVVGIVLWPFADAPCIIFESPLICIGGLLTSVAARTRYGPRDKRHKQKWQQNDKTQKAKTGFRNVADQVRGYVTVLEQRWPPATRGRCTFYNVWPIASCHMKKVKTAGTMSRIYVCTAIAERRPSDDCARPAVTADSFSLGTSI